MTKDGLVFGPAGHSGSPLTVPFTDLESVDLIEGSRPRLLVVTLPIADQVGQVVLTTTEGKVARFTGLPIRGIQDALEEDGATIVTE